MRHQDLMNVVGMRRLPSEMILQYLKDLAQAPRIVNVDVRDTFVDSHKES